VAVSYYALHVLDNHKEENAYSDGRIFLIVTALLPSMRSGRLFPDMKFIADFYWLRQEEYSIDRWDFTDLPDIRLIAMTGFFISAALLIERAEHFFTITMSSYRFYVSLPCFPPLREVYGLL